MTPLLYLGLGWLSSGVAAALFVLLMSGGRGRHRANGRPRELSEIPTEELDRLACYLFQRTVVAYDELQLRRYHEHGVGQLEHLLEAANEGGAQS